VGRAIALQTETASMDYIQLWRGDSALLRESLEAVQQTAAVILGGIAPRLHLQMTSETLSLALQEWNPGEPSQPDVDSWFPHALGGWVPMLEGLICFRGDE
jgi:hypothetical protein